jgi:signal transduction histidine kinase
MTIREPWRAISASAAEWAGSSGDSAPAADPQPVRRVCHAAQFYEDEAFLVEAVAQAVAEGLRAKDRIFVFATREHWSAFARRLKSDGRDVDGASANGQLVVVDARNALAQLMKDGAADRHRFVELVERLLEPRGSAFERARVRVYEEMTTLLAAEEGGSRAAQQLEELWSEVGREHPIALVCAYGERAFDRTVDAARPRAPREPRLGGRSDEAYARSPELGAQLREVTLLQQRARALESEILQRVEMETALREALQERRRAEEEARALNGIKDEFLATVSHELRTPLNAILGWAVMLRSNPNVDVAKAVETIERNARAQGRLIEDVLDVSRIIAGKLRIDPKSVDLAAVLRASLDVVTPAAVAKGVSLEAAIDCDPCTAQADSDRVQQIFWNLLSNAIKFTPRDGRVSARLAVEGTEVTFTVRDTGRGIDKKFLPFLFERFRQADSTSTRAERGLGLGLAIVRHLVELHGGTVVADSPGLNQGATFHVRFPARVAPAESPPRPAEARGSAEASTAGLALGGVRVLVCDDDPDACELMSAILTARGATVERASSAEEALHLMVSFHPDVLVSDIGLPAVDGYSLIRRVRALTSREGGRTPAIALTAYTRGEDARKAFAAGFQLHVAKPVDPGELVAMVANLAGRPPPA